MTILGRPPNRGRPADLPAADHYKHGTRARYVAGCRCDECRAANTAAYHDRQARAKAAAAEQPPRAAAANGICPGVNRKPCPKGTKLYRNAASGMCASCRDTLVWNGLVRAGRVRQHVRKLSALGIGYKSVADAASFGHTMLFEILSGRKRRIRRQAELRILAVTAEAIADHAIVDGAPTWQLLDELISRGFTKGEIARRLGMKMRALQIGRERILARTAYAVARLHRAAGAPPERSVASSFCDCIRPVVFELDGERYCGNCDLRARPEGMTHALLSEQRPQAQRNLAFGFAGGWSQERRTSKKAKARERLELVKLAKTGS